MTREWSAQQAAVFAWFRDGLGNLVVRARAGTGKTTTILEAIGHAPEQRILLAAFNRRIAAELQSRLANPAAEAATMHGVGYKAIRRYAPGLRVDGSGERAAALATAATDDVEAPAGALKQLARLHTLAREAAPFAAWEEIADLALDHEIEPEDDDVAEGFDVAWLAKRARIAMDIARDFKPANSTIDFADMIYLPLAKGWAKPSYDLVVVDEAQDMTMAQLELAQRICRGRIAVVGDDRQAIYGFRGADSGSIDRLLRELDAKELGLTTTYRCGRAIVATAAAIVPDFTAGHGNPEGEVVDMDCARALAEVAAGDFFLSRRNAPLVTGALALLRQGRRARIEGRDIAGSITGTVRKLATGRAKDSIPEFLRKLAAWQDRETTKARASSKNEDRAAERANGIADRAETIRAAADGVSSVRELIGRVEDLFADDGRPAVVFSSIHRSKGLEADRVFVLLDSFRGPGKADARPDPEESNLRYVAFTRAKRSLVMVGGMP